MQREIDTLRRQVEAGQNAVSNMVPSPVRTMSTAAESSDQTVFMDTIEPDMAQIAGSATLDFSPVVPIASATRQTKQRVLDDIVLDPSKIDDCFDSSVTSWPCARSNC